MTMAKYCLTKIDNHWHDSHLLHDQWRTAWIAPQELAALGNRATATWQEVFTDDLLSVIKIRQLLTLNDTDY